MLLMVLLVVPLGLEGFVLDPIGCARHTLDDELVVMNLELNQML